MSQDSPVTSKNLWSSLYLDLGLNVDVEGLVPGKFSRYYIYQIALYLCMLMSKSTSTSMSRTQG